MTDGIATGWHHALWLLGYLGGFLPVVVVLVLGVLACMALFDWVEHRVRVGRLRRQARRTGRYPLPTSEEIQL